MWLDFDQFSLQIILKYLCTVEPGCFIPEISARCVDNFFICSVGSRFSLMLKGAGGGGTNGSNQGK